MKRRRYLAVLSAGILAGCAGDGGTAETPEPTQPPTATPTATPTPTPTATEQTPTATPEFDPFVAFPECNIVSVDALEYESVAVTTQEGGEVFSDGLYSGSNRFETDSPIEAVVVTGRGQEVMMENGDYEQCITTPTPDPYSPEVAKENAAEPEYDELFRNFEDYEGEPIRFDWGQVYQAQYPEDEDYDYFQMWVSQDGDSYENDIAAVWYGDERYLEDDVFSPLYGVAERLYSYTTVQGDERTIPLLTLVDISLQD